jgi:hypothetical protein
VFLGGQKDLDELMGRGTMVRLLYSRLNHASLCLVRIFGSLPGKSTSWLFVDPVELRRLPGLNLTFLEPEGNLLLGALDTVGTVADISTNIDGIVTSDGAWGGSKRIGGTKDG